MPPLNGHRLALASLLPELRTAHEVRVLAVGGSHEGRGGHQLRVVVPAGGTTAELRDWWAFLAGGRPRRVDALVRALRPALLDELRRFDPHVVHVFSSRLASVHHLLEGRPTVLSALDAAHRNVEARMERARGPRRPALRAEARRVARFMASEYPSYDAVVLVTPEDAAAVSELAPDARVAAIPNGVDVARFAATGAGPRVDGRVVLHGALSYAPNVAAADWAAKELLPRIRARAPTTELVLVGRSPVEEVRALARRPGVVVTGEVDDVGPWLASAAVYLCPMRSGTGIKNKLLEAMAAGAPCVATPLALQGIHAVPGRDVLVGEEPDELVAHVLALLRAPERAHRLGERGRQRVLEHHSWRTAADAYGAVYTDVAARR